MSRFLRVSFNIFGKIIGGIILMILLLIGWVIYIIEADIEHEYLVDEPQYRHLLGLTYQTKFEPFLYEIYSDYPNKNGNIEWSLDAPPSVGGPEFKSRKKLQQKTVFTIKEVRRCVDCKILGLIPSLSVWLIVELENDPEGRDVKIYNGSDMIVFKDGDFTKLNPDLYEIVVR